MAAEPPRLSACDASASPCVPLSDAEMMPVSYLPPEFS